MKNALITILSLLALLIIIGFVYEVIFKKPIVQSPTIDEEINLPAYDIKEEYKDSTYTFVGTVEVPTPCHNLESEVKQVSGSKYQIIVNTISPAEGVVCAQVMTNKDFKVTFKALADAEITAVINGVEYELNRFVVPEGENIDTFKLEIKG